MSNSSCKLRIHLNLLISHWPEAVHHTWHAVQHLALGMWQRDQDWWLTEVEVSHISLDTAIGAIDLHHLIDLFLVLRS